MRKGTYQRQSGFTLIELMVVGLIALVLITLGLPALKEILLRSSLETMTQQVEAVFRRARFDAIKEGVPVIVQADPAEGELRIYTDVPVLDDNGNRTDQVLIYQPVAGSGTGTTDRILNTVALPKFVDFRAPSGDQVTEGFTNISGGPVGEAAVSELVAVFLSDGSVQDVGALRVGDTRGNYFEFRVDIAAAGRIVLSKYDCARTRWFERYYLNESTNKSEVTSRWRWYTSAPEGC